MRTVETLKKVTLRYRHYSPQIDYSSFDDNGSEFKALRFCYYTHDGRYPNRPLFIGKKEFIELLVSAFEEQIFNDDERETLINKLKKIKKPAVDSASLFGKYSGDVQENEFKELNKTLIDRELTNE